MNVCMVAANYVRHGPMCSLRSGGTLLLIALLWAQDAITIKAGIAKMGTA